MRVDVEEDLWISGRLPKLARTLKWDEDRALGRLVKVYRRTQKARIAVAELGRILTVIVVDFESDDEANTFVAAMITAQLASVLDGDRVRIHGNEKHVERFDRMLANASEGGKASAAKRQKNLNGSVTTRLTDAQAHAQPKVNQEPSVSERSQAPRLPGSQADASYEASEEEAPGPADAGRSLTHAAHGNLAAPEKKKRGRRRSGTNPRALGTNPRAKRKAAREQARQAQLEKLDPQAHIADAHTPEALAAAEVARAELRRKLRISNA